MSNSKVAADSSVGSNSDETITTAVGATMIALSLIAVGFRFYARFSLKTGFGWDDWFILVAIASLVAAGICVLAGMSTYLVLTHECCALCGCFVRRSLALVTENMRACGYNLILSQRGSDTARETVWLIFVTNDSIHR